LTAVGGVTVDLVSQLSAGRTVMVEHHSGKPKS
jgi:hypothetical protein